MTSTKPYKLTHREFVVLGLISEESSHAYKIDKKIEERGMRDWTSIGTSSIYSDLNNLDENGFVDSYHEEHDNRMRRVYEITEKGLSNLKKKAYNVLREFYGKNDEDFYVAFSMLPILSKEEQIEAISHSIRKIKNHIGELNAMLEENSKMPLNVTGLFIHPIKIMEADVEFLEWVLKKIKEGKGNFNPKD